MKNNIYLIGYRCTGKTTVGQILAKKLDKNFVDADYELEKEAGKSIALIVEKEGWEGFRKREKNVIARLSGLSDYVIAPGGGAVLDPDNALAMKNTGLVVWLIASPEIIAERMGADEKTEGQRPSLTSQGVLDEIKSVLKQRTPIYRKAADTELSTDYLSIQELAEKIIEIYKAL